MDNRLSDRRKSAWMLPAAVFCALLLFLAGCAPTNHGRFKLNDQVGQAFREGRVDPGFRYYFAGRETMPYAIIGIDAAYTVPSKFWIHFEPDAEQLKQMSNNVFGRLTSLPYGAYLLGPDGNVIGIWYAAIDNRSVSVNPEDRTVQVRFRNPESRSRGR